MGNEITRRGLLAGAGAGVLGLGLPSLLQLQLQRSSYEDLSWEEIRNLFELDSTYIHMAGLLLASHPKPVRDAIESARKALDKNPVDALHELGSVGERNAREAAAKYINGSASDVALTDSTTMGLAMLYNGLNLPDGQEIVTTTHDHMATHESLRLRSQKRGTKIRQIELYADPSNISVDEVVRNLTSGIRPETGAVAVTWVHSSTGVRLPLQQMSEAIAKLNATRVSEDKILFCVDCVHGFGVEDFDVRSYGMDFFAAGTHKWLFGPRGTGILWGKRESQRFLSPTIPTFSPLSWGGSLTPGGFHSFEHRWALAAAFRLHQQIGKKRVRDRIHEHARYAKAELAKMSKVKLHTPMSDDLSAGLICFDVDGMNPGEVVSKLANKRIIASTTPYRVSYARITPGLLNSSAEVEKTVAAIHDLAR